MKDNPGRAVTYLVGFAMILGCAAIIALVTL